ncbi:MAG: GntR family transcriptional regulator [Alphaproteobacteria bacterium]|nr:MAG: GntR family transcriptional regulator [Alphaproteobacteria bacterium]
MDGAPGFRPLYRQVYDYLVKQISEGAWKAAEALPSEQALAAELGVSQGTVRKALDVMAAEKLIERRQGKGTYVAEHTQERALFRFFRLARPEGERVLPECGAEEVKRRRASARDANKLELPADAAVVEIKRTRLVDGAPAVFETIIIPESIFPDIEQYAPLPNALYSLYQTVYGVNIVQTIEELRADLVRKEDAKRLHLPLGAPLLHIDRIAVALDGMKVEWRISRCDTTHLVYAVTIR